MILLLIILSVMVITIFFVIEPNSCVFVKTNEKIHNSEEMVAFVYERTSVMRLGLKVDHSPLKPGFCGYCYIRVSNVSNKSIELKKGFGIAQVAFYKLSEKPLSPYNSQKNQSFQNEEEFSGLGDYHQY